MRRILITFMLSGWITGAAVWAADDQVSSDDTTLRSTTEATEVTSGYLKNEAVGIKPQVGLMTFTDQLGATTTRAAYGATIDGNIATWISKDWSSLYLGPSTGFIYSHLGNPTSNFVGTDSSLNAGAAGANTLLIPANLKVGYNVTDFFRVAAHGGGNVIYRSIASSMALGDSTTPNPAWRIFPNVGADAEFALGRNVALMLRPDWTIAPGSSIFTGTLALNVPIG